MKKLLLPFSLILGTLGISNQNVLSQDKKIIEDYLVSKLAYRVNEIDPAAVNKVFMGKFYIVSSGYTDIEGTGYCSNFYFNDNGGKLVEFEQPTADKEFPILLGMVKKDFRLKDEPSAKIYETALNVLFPVKDSEKAGLKHMKKNGQWIFIRGKFFDDYTAFIITTSPVGEITKIEIKLSYPIK